MIFSAFSVSGVSAIRESVSPESQIVESLTPQLIHRRSNLKELGYV